MSGIANVIRKHDTYYFRRVIRLGSTKPFRLRLSLRTTCRHRARLLASALTLSCERVKMNIMSGRFGASLTPEQRAEIFRRQMLIERERIEVVHAGLHIQPAEDHADSDKALFLRLGASELAAQDGIAKGKVDDFVITRIDPDADDEPIVLVAWSDLAASMEQDSAEEAALARLSDIGIEPTPMREAMARKAVNEARVVAVREYRNVLDNPAAAYPTVPVASYGQPSVSHTPAHPQLLAQPFTPGSAPGTEAAAPNPWGTMLPTEAVEKFFHFNPRTGGADGTVRKRGANPWTEKTRNQCRVGALSLEPKSLSTLVKVPYELLQDSVNIADILQQAITAAMATKLDYGCLFGSGTGSEIQGLFGTAGINSVSMGTNGATPSSYDNMLDMVYELELDNSGEPTAAIWHPRTARTFRKFKDGQNNPLSVPSPIAELPKLSTTAVPIDQTQGTETAASTVLMGDFTQAILGIREQLTIIRLDQTFAANGQVGFWARMRVDVGFAHPESFCKLIGIKP